MQYLFIVTLYHIKVKPKSKKASHAKQKRPTQALRRSLLFRQSLISTLTFLPQVPATDFITERIAFAILP